MVKVKLLHLVCEEDDCGDERKIKGASLALAIERATDFELRHAKCDRQQRLPKGKE